MQFAGVDLGRPGSSVGAAAVKVVDKEAIKQTYGASPAQLPQVPKVVSSSAGMAAPTKESTPQPGAAAADEETDEFGYTASDDEACATIDLSLSSSTLSPSFFTSPPLTIFTDGSCLSNGTPTARAGIGIYFGPSDPRNTAARLPGTTQTNNRAELFAVIRALEIALDKEPGRGVIVYSDSSYMRQGMEKWVKGWMKRGWKTREGKNVLNKDLWLRLEGLKGRFPKDGVVFVSYELMKFGGGGYWLMHDLSPPSLSPDR